MSRLRRALAQEQNPGVYRFQSEASAEFLRGEAENAGWKFYYLDGSKIFNKKSFLEKIARAMKFPAYFGKNWDALNDSLTDLQGIDTNGYILLFQAPERFSKNSPADFQVAMEILESAIEYWHEQGIPFYVLLRGQAPAEFPLL